MDKLRQGEKKRERRRLEGNEEWKAKKKIFLFLCFSLPPLRFLDLHLFFPQPNSGRLICLETFFSSSAEYFRSPTTLPSILFPLIIMNDLSNAKENLTTAHLQSWTTSSNLSPQPTQQATLLGAILAFVFIFFGLIGNILLITAILSVKKLRSNIINIFIVSVSYRCDICLSLKYSKHQLHSA